MTAVRKLCSDADDDVGTRDSGTRAAAEPIAVYGRTRLVRTAANTVAVQRHDGGEWRPYSDDGIRSLFAFLVGILKVAEQRAESAKSKALASEEEAHTLYETALALVAERDQRRRFASAWKTLARSSRREIGYLERELGDAEARAKDAERRFEIANRALAGRSEYADLLEARVAELDLMVDNMLVERQRMQADVNALIEENNGMREEATCLLTRARVADLEKQRDREAARASDAEAACRDATSALVRAEARIAQLQDDLECETAGRKDAEMVCSAAGSGIASLKERIAQLEATVERARECVRHGLSAVGDEEFLAEYARRFGRRNAA